MVNVLLISTYELGRQPIHVAAPAASIRAAGHTVRALDLAVESLEQAALTDIDKVAISVPMHTATRLAGDVVEAIRGVDPAMPIALYGLYAEVGDAPADARFSGEYEPALLEWVQGGLSARVRHIGKSDLTTPDRSVTRPLADYARLEYLGETRLVGAVEASHGCRHRCRHCPLPVVYDGRIRVVPRDSVVADIDALVEAGAKHITFGDADFLNAPAHSIGVLEEAHARHPEITFDATVKVSHILEHADSWTKMAELNLLFVISAFESTDDVTLEILDKNHTRADMESALSVMRAAGVHVRPTWLPFMPWTTTGDVADIFEFIATNDLAAATDPVQMAIKLLVPPGSLLLEHEAMQAHLEEYDPSALTWQWSFADPEVDVLWKDLDAIAAEASDCGAETVATLRTMAGVVAAASDRPPSEMTASVPVPRLTESWFCCAEPTPGQSSGIRIGRP